MHVYTIDGRESKKRTGESGTLGRGGASHSCDNDNRCEIIDRKAPERRKRPRETHDDSS